MDGRRARGRPMGAPRAARAEIVQQALLEAGLSLTELATRLGIARSTLRRWLDGEARATAAFSLDELCAARGVAGARRARLMAGVEGEALPPILLLPMLREVRLLERPSMAL